MLKKYLLATALFLLTVSGPLVDVFAFCLVTSSRDYQPCSMGSGMNVNPAAYLSCRLREFKRESRTLRYQVEREYRDESTTDPAPTIENPPSFHGTCPTGDHDTNYTEDSDSDPLDDWLGFEQAILFATSEWDNPNTSNNNESWRNASGGFIDINTIILRAPISFQNRYDNVAVGNWTLTTPPESLFDYIGSGDMSYGERLDVLNMFPENYRDHGSVTIDGTDLAENQSPFVCGAANTMPVILRNLVILTNGVTSAEFFSLTNQQQDCFQDGGDVFICGGDVDDTRVIGAEGWCVEVTKVPVEDCDDPGEPDDEDGNGFANCLDLDNCADEEVCQRPTENCSTTDDEDGDGLGSCDDPDCGEEPACQIEICDNLMDDGDDDDLIDCEDPDCAGAPHCITPPMVEDCDNGVDDADADSDIDCADSECISDPACVIVPPGTEDNCTDSLDNDDDGSTDCGDADCSTDAACVIVPPGTENCTNGADDDGDTKIDCLDTDCLVSDACQVVATETGYCADTLDNDSDGSVDCADSDCSSLAACEVTDGGGDGVCGTIDTIDYLAARGRVAVANCADPDCALLPECEGTVASEAGACADGEDNDDDGRTDCNDSDCSGSAGCVGGPSAEAGYCTDSVDNDSDGALDCNDSDCASDTLCVCLFDPNCTVLDYSDDNIDDDGDGFTVNGGDCNDKASAIHPAETETCDEIDNDCDGIADEVCQGEPDVDDDGDGFCESFVFCLGEAQPGDCDDNNADVKPGATEICDDDMDNNCDGHEGLADDIEGIDLDSGDDTEGGTTVPAVPALMRIARADGDDETPVITIEGSGDETQPINPVIDLSCEISDLEGDKGEGGGGCGCDLSGKKSSPQTAAVWFFLTMIPLALVTRLRLAKS